MSDIDPCEICDSRAETLGTAGYDGIHQRCPQCGEFRIAVTALSTITRIRRHSKPKLWGYVRDQNALGEVAELTSDRLTMICAQPVPSLLDRADRLLSHVVRGQQKLGESFNLEEPALIAVTYSQDRSELHYLAKFLQSEGFIENDALESKLITPRGYMRYEQLQGQQVASAQGFVAMWFDPTMLDAYTDGFEIGIRRAGYDPVRVDHVEHIGKIDDEIIAQIRRSRFVVADFTGQRAGVYFEAGFAFGLDLPVIWACRRDEIADLHFDIRQFNCIDWTDPAELADRLHRRIEATIGAGPRKPIV